MRGLADQRKNECERVFTTRHACVAVQTRPARGVSSLQELTRIMVGPRIAPLTLNGSRSDPASVAAICFRPRAPL